MRHVVIPNSNSRHSELTETVTLNSPARLHAYLYAAGHSELTETVILNSFQNLHLASNIDCGSSPQ